MQDDIERGISNAIIPAISLLLGFGLCLLHRRQSDRRLCRYLLLLLSHIMALLISMHVVISWLLVQLTLRPCLLWVVSQAHGVLVGTRPLLTGCSWWRPRHMSSMLACPQLLLVWLCLVPLWQPTSCPTPFLLGLCWLVLRAMLACCTHSVTASIRCICHSLTAHATT